MHNKAINNYLIKKNKLITTRIKLDLLADGNKNNAIKNFIKNHKNNKNINNKISPKNNNNSSNKKIIYIDNNNFKNANSKELLYNNLGPNSQNVNKSKLISIKEINKNINYNNQGRNSYNIYISSPISNTNNFNINNNINNNINSHAKIFIKKIKKDNIKINHSNSIHSLTKTINYNSDNMNEFQNSNLSVQNKKIIVFNNINNYNINNTNNTFNNTNNTNNIKEGQNNNNNIYKKTIDILSPFSSINNKNNNTHKKLYINKQNSNVNNNQKNKNKISYKEKRNLNRLDKNIIYLDNHKSKNTHTFAGSYNSNIINKYLYNKNLIYKLNKNGNYNHPNDNSSHYSYNIRIDNINQNNNINQVSNSNDKERNTINNKSFGNLYLIKNKKPKNHKDKNNTLEIFEKNSKTNFNNNRHISPIQELKNKF